MLNFMTREKIIACMLRGVLVDMTGAETWGWWSDYDKTIENNSIELSYYIIADCEANQYYG